jgi:hypothetical protein
MRQHASAYVSMRQHTSAHISTHQHTSAYVSIRQHTSAYVSIRQHTSAYVSIRQYMRTRVPKSKAKLLVYEALSNLRKRKRAICTYVPVKPVNCVPACRHCRSSDASVFVLLYQ